MIDAVKKYTGVDFNTIESDADAVSAIESLGIEHEDGLTRGQCIALAFEEKVEEKLVNPTFIIDYPVEVSPLAKRKPDDPRLTERFEIFIMGREGVDIKGRILIFSHHIWHQGTLPFFHYFEAIIFILRYSTMVEELRDKVYSLSIPYRVLYSSIELFLR